MTRECHTLDSAVNSGQCRGQLDARDSEVGGLLGLTDMVPFPRETDTTLFWGSEFAAHKADPAPNHRRHRCGRGRFKVHRFTGATRSWIRIRRGADARAQG